MPYIYADAAKLDGQPKVEDYECVALIRYYTNANSAAAWREGAKVLGNRTILPGTAIATFVNGRWPGLPKGNHSAFYLGQISNGIYVVDQWPAKEKKLISKRFIYAKKVYADGTYETPSDNALAFSVIR
ncbi:MAG: BPSL0067 family protein [Massilia sp.]